MKGLPGECIAISGVGGLGHLAIPYARLMGRYVCAINIDDGKLHADIELQPLLSINQVFDRLEHGDVASRVVLEFAST